MRQLRLDPLLDRVAQAQAEGSDSTARGALNEAKRGLKRGGWAWVATMSELQGLELPEDVLERKWRRLGVGVAQDTDREGPDITVVLIVGG